MLEQLLKWDKQAFIYLNSLGTAAYDSFWLTVTNFTTWIPLFLLIIFLLFWKNSYQQGFRMLFFFLAMLIVVAVLIFATKEGLGRLRPNNEEELITIIRVLKMPQGYSFFSGHAASSFSIATLAILFLNKRYPLIICILVWPFLFALSRIYVGVHYPLDIIVGSIIGILSGFIFYRLHQKVKVPDTM